MGRNGSSWNSLGATALGERARLPRLKVGTPMTLNRFPIGQTMECRFDLLAFVSGFSSFAGPNSPILDLGNCIACTLGIRFAIVTTSEPGERLFRESIRFPVFRILTPGLGRAFSRLFLGPIDVVRIRKLLRRGSARRILVFSAIDTAFKVAFAIRRSVLVGYNTLFNFPHRDWGQRFHLPKSDL